MRKVTRRLLLLSSGSFVMSCLAIGPSRLWAQEVGTSHEIGVHGGYSDGWLLTAEDRSEYASGDEMVESEFLELRDATDLPGNDIRGFRSGGLQECVTACEADSECQAFTFAKSTHGSSRKQRMCWIKGGSYITPKKTSDVYISGFRNNLIIVE